MTTTTTPPPDLAPDDPDLDLSTASAAGVAALFQDPPGFYPLSPPPKTESYTTASGAAAVITLHLVGHSPLEAHHLWNGARAVAAHFEADPDATVRGRTVLELGAGAGLPSIVAATLGARTVVVTDYPDPELLEVMARNVEGAEALFPRRGGQGGKAEGRLPVVVVEGLVWGADPGRVLRYLEEEEEEEKEDEGDEGDGRKEKKKKGEGKPGFDVLILADLLFRHSEHGNMLRTVRQTLKMARDSRAYVVFTSYRPWLQQRDLAFFDLAREQGFVVDKIFEKKTERPLFEDDPGDEEVRKTVTGWVLRWPEDALERGGS